MLLSQTLAIFVVSIIGYLYNSLSSGLLNRPLVTGALVGIALGDIPTGCMAGAALELVYLGSQAIGASNPPDMISGTIIGTAYVITTGAGDPGKYMAAWKEAGCKVAPVVASATLARRMERAGADAIIAEGMEAGGHIGQITTMTLIPAVRAAVSVPLIAAGGVADGRGMAAAMMLGAEGVQMGTRFLTIEECTIADAYKEKVLAAKDSDTLVTGQNSGHPVRQLKNRFARTAKHMESDASVTSEELEQFMAGSLRKAVVDGDVVNGSMMSGISACLVHERGTAADVIAEVIGEAEELLGLGAEKLIEMNARAGRVSAAHAE